MQSAPTHDRKDAELLGKALEVFHLQCHDLCLSYRDWISNIVLNPGSKAYLGVCYYYKWDYENTINIDCRNSQVGELRTPLTYFSIQPALWLELLFNLALQKAVPCYQDMLKTVL